MIARLNAAIGAAISFYVIANNNKKKNRNENFNPSRNGRRQLGRYPGHEKLVMASVVIRHGSRTPVATTPNCEQANWDSSILLQTLPHADCPHKVVSLDGGPQPPLNFDLAYNKDKVLKGGCPGGQLTILGQEQMVQLGKRLRERYIDQFNLLEPSFQADSIYIRTSNILRSINSAKCFMVGLYSELTERSKDDPIILHTTESKNEFLYPNVGSCPLMKKFYRAVHKHNEFESAGRRIFHDVLQIDDMKSLYENKLLAKNHIDILDDLESRRAHGMALPDVLIDHYSQIKEIGYKALCSLFSENVLLKVSSGRFMDDILKRMDAVVNNQSPTRLCLYSAHDTSLIVLSAAVTGKLPNAWPPFASFLVFELYRTFSGKHYVKVKFENQDLVINNCGGSTECPYNRFREIVSELALESKEFEELCSIQDGN